MKTLKTPITYYGGKQRLVSTILPLIPEHTTYVEPFVGGGAIFWAKPPSKVEIINDYNRELINFYEVCKNEFIELEKMIRISLHSRSLHTDATVMYDNPHLFTRIQRAWAVWVLSSQGFASRLDSPWGYDIRKNTMVNKLNNKRDSFTEQFSIRLQNVQIENTDALRVIRSRDHKEAFHYCDPPYYNSDCGHYDGYSKDDFEMLLRTLEHCEGRFLLSSYPSDILKDYTKKNKWSTQKLAQSVSVTKTTRGQKKKIEVLTANYDLANPREAPILLI